MSSETSNDNAEGRYADAPDAHGQTALLLVESLVHGLIAKELLSVADAVEIIDVAAEVKDDVGRDQGETPMQTRKSLNLLEAIRGSLSRDLHGE